MTILVHFVLRQNCGHSSCLGWACCREESVCCFGLGQLSAFHSTAYSGYDSMNAKCGLAAGTLACLRTFLTLVPGRPESTQSFFPSPGRRKTLFFFGVDVHACRRGRPGPEGISKALFKQNRSDFLAPIVSSRLAKK